MKIKYQILFSIGLLFFACSKEPDLTCAPGGCPKKQVAVVPLVSTSSVIAKLDSFNILAGQSDTLNVLHNDVYDSSFATVQIVKQPNYGVGAIYQNQIIFKSDSSGLDSLTYFICDSTGCDTANVYLNQVSFSLFPNPTSKELYLSGVEFFPENEILLYNSNGQLVSSKKNYKSNTNLLEGHTMPAGLYILLVNIDGKKPVAMKFVLLNSVNTKTVYPTNGISPNNDGTNDKWIITNIENYPSNEVSIYNRWGDEVWNTLGYNNNSNYFGGNNLIDSTLADGTYFYVIDLKDTTVAEPKINGWLLIKR